MDEDEGLVPGTGQFEVSASVRVEETDLKATKRHASAFDNPEFGKTLQNMGCDTLMIVGLSASGCVLATYFGALDWDIRPYLVKGGVASANEEHVRLAEEICDTMTLDVLDNALSPPVR